MCNLGCWSFYSRAFLSPVLLVTLLTLLTPQTQLSAAAALGGQVQPGVLEPRFRLWVSAFLLPRVLVTLFAPPTQLSAAAALGEQC
jgi:hypothetical protein